MNNRTFLILASFIGLLFVFSAKAEEGVASMTKETLRDASEFVVKEDWIACYKDKNGTPSDDIVEIFYSGDSVFPQHWQHWAPYTEHESKLYLWVKYNDTPAVGCFVEATTESISAVKTTSTENSAPIDTASAESTENTPPANIASTDNAENAAPANTDTAPAENSPPENDTQIENVPLVDSASTENTPPLDGNADESLKVNCVAPGTTATRQLETSYENHPSTLPCKVVYFREDGTTQVIAEAKATEGYCTEKRNEFLEKLKGWGWQCQ